MPSGKEKIPIVIDLARNVLVIYLGHRNVRTTSEVRRVNVAELRSSVLAAWPCRLRIVDGESGDHVIGFTVIRLSASERWRMIGMEIGSRDTTERSLRTRDFDGVSWSLGEC